MGKKNRGETTKLSIKLSIKAFKRIERASENLNLSKAGVISFALANIFKNAPSMTNVLNLEQQVILEPDNFSLTIKKDFALKIDELQKQLGMKKNHFMGLLISDYFERLEEHSPVLKNDLNTDPKQMMIQVNEDLKKKIVDYSEKHYIPISGLISYCILNGPINYLPIYKTDEYETIFTRVPAYIIDLVKKGAERHSVPDHFYAALCCHKAFTSDNKIFDV
ncbi:hypothetical protein EV207_12513 [Scopulibacillus darangshiensis]|uniref:Uncharacterized protein n=1 Tax=Scopulibacillus darangshiensis TaxID=442528 RepID=A0A4R2NRB7_9BACL|nr:hypothetical protein [Scopulibacillus darangshiensis]TCP24453.1 hypothetical protein EV207_12513 [Scopulibacillus darangshiensis]